MAASSSKEATAYLIDPLTAPEPSQETGLGTHFTPPSESSVANNSTGASSSSTNPFRQHRSTPSTSSRHSRGNSGSEKAPTHRVHELGGLNDASPPTYDAPGGSRSTGRRRTSSLKERYPGDESHKPLDILRRDSKKASRSPHLSKRQMPGTDSIDRLDPSVSKPYHHEGPYDAASLARNRVPGQGPIDALKTSNAEALKATPPENIKDSLERHVPLSGTAVVPPGDEDRYGRRYSYEEGGNMMFDNSPAGGQYKRYPDLPYDPEDIHGKGEPYFSRDRHMKEQGLSSDKYDDAGIELTSQTKHHDHADIADADVTGREQNESGGFTEGLKKRIGSLRKKHHDH